MLADDYVAAVARAGDRLAEAADLAGLDAPVPTCPGWQVRDLVQHVGAVHHWAAAHLSDQRTTELEGELVDLVGGWPAAGELLDWFRREHAALLEAFATADREFPYFSWLPAPTPYDFWARRMTHETTVHAMDADAAAGRDPAPGRAIALDGIDDLLCSILANRSKGPAVPTPVTLALEAADADDRWHVRLDPAGYEVVKAAPTSADCVVRATAVELYRLVWHRAGAEAMDLHGDVAVLDQFWANVNIRWT